ncbi:FAD-binding protein [Candidatus Woesearchaeota archaeon]|nr:FAD-binding protein [Candidatus Woesearchaeota archaeon]
MEKQELIIIGGGPAGLTAAVYAARYQIKTTVIAKETGGLAARAHKICNFPSYIEISGFELMQKMVNQVKHLKVPILYETVTDIRKSQEGFDVFTNSDKVYKSDFVIFATGTKWKSLGVKGEVKFLGKGVSYCATCDGPFFKDKKVAVVGGGDAALTSALLMTEYAKKVYQIYRRDRFFRPEPAWIQLVKKNQKIQIIFNDEITQINGDKFVTGINLKSGENLDLDGVFIEIGSKPDIAVVKNLGLITQKDYIVTDNNQETNIEGFYAAGDITNNKLKQIINAASQGSIAAYNVYLEIQKKQAKREEYVYAKSKKEKSG